jgi:hypothetical protein
MDNWIDNVGPRQTARNETKSKRGNQVLNINSIVDICSKSAVETDFSTGQRLAYGTFVSESNNYKWHTIEHWTLVLLLTAGLSFVATIQHSLSLS